MASDTPANGAPATRDVVDEAEAQWAKLAPALDATPMQVTLRILRLAHGFEALRARILGSYGLGHTEFDVLATLRRADDRDGLNPKRLLESVLVTSGSLTPRLDRLVAAGLVRRRPDRADGRAIRVVLTATGRRTADACVRDVFAAEAAVLAESGIDVAAFASAARALAGSLAGTPRN